MYLYFVFVFNILYLVKIPVLGLTTILRYDIMNSVVIILRSSHGATITKVLKPHWVPFVVLMVVKLRMNGEQ